MILTYYEGNISKVKVVVHTLQNPLSQCTHCKILCLDYIFGHCSNNFEDWCAAHTVFKDNGFDFNNPSLISEGKCGIDTVHRAINQPLNETY